MDIKDLFPEDPRAARQAAIDKALRVHTSEWVDEIVQYHKPDTDQIVKHGELRAAAAVFIKAICAQCEESSDRAKAIECAREALMFANAAVALRGAI